MKIKKKIMLISAIVILIICSVAIIYNSYTKTTTLEYKIHKLDKAYSNLDELELNAPFDLNVINKYKIISLSTEMHVGIDFYSQAGNTSIPFLAVKDGVVTHVQTRIMYDQDGTDNWAVSIMIAINSRYTIALNFETFGYTDEIKQMQEENIFVNIGDHVKQGDVIGNLIIGSINSHVDFTLIRQNSESGQSFVAPEPYFSESAMTLINNALYS